jgi:transcriptional regulator with XRE-family HTH domain
MKARPPMYVSQPCPWCGGRSTALNGAWLRSVREDEGVSLRAMARRAKVSAAYLSDVERNRRGLSGRGHASDRVRKAYGIPASSAPRRGVA